MQSERYKEQIMRLNVMLAETPDEATLVFTLALHDTLYGLLKAFAERAGCEEKVRVLQQLSATVAHQVINAALDAEIKKAAERN